MLDITEENIKPYGEIFLTHSFNHVPIIHTSIEYNNNILYFSGDVIKTTVTSEKNNLKLNYNKECFGEVDHNNEYRFKISTIYNYPGNSICISSKNKDPFILFLGITPEEIKPFHFCGKYGIHIYPNIWHSHPIIYYSGRVEFEIKKCVSDLYMKHKIDTIVEYA